MILKNDTLVAVTDGERLRLFKSKGHEPHLELIEMDGPAMDRIHAGSGGRHRSSTAKPDDARLREDDFAGSVAAYLNDQAAEPTYEHLLVIADRRTLGELRKHYQPVLIAKLAGEVGKDFVKQSVESIKNAIAVS